MYGTEQGVERVRDGTRGERVRDGTRGERVRDATRGERVRDGTRRRTCTGWNNEENVLYLALALHVVFCQRLCTKTFVATLPFGQDRGRAQL